MCRAMVLMEGGRLALLGPGIGMVLAISGAKALAFATVGIDLLDVRTVVAVAAAWAPPCCSRVGFPP